MRRYLRMLLVAAMAAALGSSFAPQPAAAESVDVMLINEHSGLCAAFVDTEQFFCEFSQPWEMITQGNGEYTFLDFSTDKCLTVKDNSTAVGARVVQGVCDARSSNRWRRTQVRPSDFHFVNANSGMCLTVSGASLEPGAKLIQFPCNTEAPHNETWNTFPVFLD